MAFSKDFIDYVSSLSDAVALQQESAAAMVYRLMLRGERNLNILDHYADQLLDGIVGMGSKYAEEDYLNYLRYIKAKMPEEFPAYYKMYEEAKGNLDSDDV